MGFLLLQMIKDFQEFLGMMNFCHSYIPQATNFMLPLYSTQRQGPHKQTNF